MVVDFLLLHAPDWRSKPAGLLLLRFRFIAAAARLENIFWPVCNHFLHFPESLSCGHCRSELCVAFHAIRLVVPPNSSFLIAVMLCFPSLSSLLIIMREIILFLRSLISQLYSQFVWLPWVLGRLEMLCAPPHACIMYVGVCCVCVHAQSRIYCLCFVFWPCHHRLAIHVRNASIVQ